MGKQREVQAINGIGVLAWCKCPNWRVRGRGGVLRQASKYGSKKTIVDGITLDSKKEAERYAELKLLERAGEIKDLELQPMFILQEGYKLMGKGKVRPITYFADFKYWTKDNILVVEDAKGIRTEVYRIKKKLFEYKYQMSITEV